MKHKWFFLLILLWGCGAKSEKQTASVVLSGAYQIGEYLPILEGKNVGATVNHSSLVGTTHLVDTLISRGVNLSKVFTPEHGFTGKVSDGEIIEYDEKVETYELISLYGKNKKPTQEQLQGIDIMLFDIQDVGTRFYTYIGTMHYVMEACAEANIPVVLLDRPNPNASYVDGPLLDTALSSFVGMHPIPIVYGLTMGELALMINGEQWLKNGITCNVQVVKNQNWDHQTTYSLLVKPSPNLPNDLSVSLYPSLCLFEGTIVSVGRGTDYPFQQIGHPDYPDSTHTFTPVSMEGSKWPPLEDQQCYGRSFTDLNPTYEFNLGILIETYNKMKQEDFFNDYFRRLAGNDELQKQIESGMSEEEIRQSWSAGLNAYKEMRKSYLLYD